MKRAALNGVNVAFACLALGVITPGTPALADRNPRVTSIDYVDCDDIRGWVLPRFTGCRGDGAQSIEATLVRCSDLKRDVAATLSECVIDTRGGTSSGNGSASNGNRNGNDGGDGGDNGGGNGGGKGPSASASAGGSGSSATASSGSGPKASASAGPGGASGSASSGSGSVSSP